MNSYKDPFTPLIDNPVNIDAPIQSLQQAFAAGLPWLSKSFARAYLAARYKTGPSGNKVPVYYPQVWQGMDENGNALDLLEVMPNDNLEAQSFFKVEEPIECLKYLPNGHSLMSARVSIIFWFNMERIQDRLDPAKTLNYSFNEVLKGSVQRVITNHVFDPGSDIKILRVWETPKQVFAGYTIDDIRDQELIYPYGGFRFECQLVYQETCPDDEFALPGV